MWHISVFRAQSGKRIKNHEKAEDFNEIFRFFIWQKAKCYDTLDIEV